ncbi:MAG: RNA-binding cell elongation regulator Jag/EloR [bacterium]
MANELEIEGANVQEAINKGLEKLSVKREQIEVKILAEGASGLFGLVGSKPAKVRIKLKIQDNLKSSKVKDNKKPEQQSSQIEDKKKKALEVTNTVLKLMKLDCITTTVEADDEAIKIIIDGNDKRILIGRDGQTLHALQLIISLIMGKDPDSRIRIELDVDNYQKRRKDQLTQLALKTAEQVQISGETQSLNPMSSRDRLVIHMALKDNEDIETYSDGEGNTRKVYVKLKKH